MGSIMKKVKERSEKLKNCRNENKNEGRNINKTNVVILAACVLVVIFAVFMFIGVLNGNNSSRAVELSVHQDMSSSYVSDKFLNLLIADMKHNGIGDDMIAEYAVESAALYLQTEYYCDYVYNVPLDAEQQNSIDEAINRLIGKHGSESKLEKYLSKYGTDVFAVRRYFELSLKQSNVLSYLEKSVTLDQMKDYFFDNYMAVDVVIVFNDADNPGLAQQVYEKIIGGELTLDEARELYSGDELKEYKGAFFISKTNEEGFDEFLFEKISKMKEGEISVADMGFAGYIIRRNAADTEIFMENEELYASIRSTVKEQLYKSICDTLSDCIFVNEGVVGKINPSKIQALNISSLTGF